MSIERLQKLRQRVCKTGDPEAQTESVQLLLELVFADCTQDEQKKTIATLAELGIDLEAWLLQRVREKQFRPTATE